ncbi:MAG: DeoR family transcriptional regulator [Candidatus Omnitrophica bacterium]|nr:DeoR family transcriptional regulator [Candidatus Omnitrophota bacterium]
MHKYDSDTRKWRVLAAVINSYIRTAIPVSSDSICRNFDYSPATIRNVLSQLEEDGYLTHPHTSAGRVPTDKGYRYYVDFLRSQMDILNEEKEKVSSEIDRIDRRIKRLEDALETTSEAIFHITHTTGIVSSVDDSEHLFFTGFSCFAEQPEFRNIERLRGILRILEEKQRLIDILNREIEENVKIYIGSELNWPDMDECAIIVSKYNVKDKPSGRMAVFGPRRMDYERLIPTLGYLSERVSEILSQF